MALVLESPTCAPAHTRGLWPRFGAGWLSSARSTARSGSTQDWLAGFNGGLLRAPMLRILTVLQVVAPGLGPGLRGHVRTPTRGLQRSAAIPSAEAASMNRIRRVRRPGRRPHVARWRRRWPPQNGGAVPGRRATDPPHAHWPNAWARRWGRRSSSENRPGGGSRIGTDAVTKRRARRPDAAVHEHQLRDPAHRRPGGEVRRREEPAPGGLVGHLRPTW